MNKIFTILKILLGVILKLFTYLLNQDRNLWVIGSGKGLLFSDNSKFFFQHVHYNVKQIKIYWISQNKALVKELRSKGYNAEYNYSFKGLLIILRSGVYIFSTLRSDILYYFPVKSKIIVNLFHAMPIKKIIYDYDGLDLPKTPIISNLWNQLAVGFVWEDIHLNIATSKFFEKILKGAYRNERIVSTGIPRCDIFFDVDTPEIQEIINPKNKFIITYLPTHRRFGKGKPNPLPFINNDVANKYFSENNIQFIFKMHYNMVSDNELQLNENLLDVTNSNVDTQELMKISDILISDYSSVIIDYLLLDRPQILYFYDSYKDQDTGLYIDVENQENAPGKITFNEDDLFAEIKELFEGRDKFKEIRKNFTDLYFAYKDGKSSERIVANIKNIINRMTGGK